ncbi:MAG: TRAP transporter small permease [Burkholderiales bacterium]
MRPLSRSYDVVIYGMAWLAGFLLVAMMVMIVADVVIRNPPFSAQSPAWLFTFTEYSLLLVPCLGAPWLVREKGHVFVEILLMYLNKRNRFRASRVIAVACIVICLVLAWYGGEVAIRDFTEGRQDTRAFDTPRWIVVLWIPLAFFFMAVEFARFLWRGENFLGLTAEGAGGVE